MSVHGMSSMPMQHVIPHVVTCLKRSRTLMKHVLRVMTCHNKSDDMSWHVVTYLMTYHDISRHVMKRIKLVSHAHPSNIS